MKAKSGHFVEELMVIKLFRCNYARDLFYSLLDLPLCLIFFVFSKFVSKYIIHNPILFQSTNDGVLYHYPLFGMVLILIFFICLLYRDFYSFQKLYSYDFTFVGNNIIIIKKTISLNL